MHPYHSIDDEPNQEKTNGVGYRSIVFGGLDGILSSLTILSAAIGGQLPVRVVVIIGVSCVVANGLAVGLGEYLSSKAHYKYVLAERRREQYDYKNYRDEEVRSLVSLFRSQGMSTDDAELVVGKLSKYENLFVNLMLTEEKGLVLPEDTEFELCTDAGLMLLAFGCFGSIPLCTVYAGAVFGLPLHVNYAAALAIALIMLVVFGYIKTSFCVVKTFLMGLQPIGIGFCCGTISFCLATIISGYVAHI